VVGTSKPSFRSAAALAAAVAVASLAPVGVALAATVTAHSGPLTASFTAGTHHPNCKQFWPVTIRATFHGRPAHATAVYQFVYDGQVVHTENPFSGTKRNRGNHIWHFVGSFKDRHFGPFGSLAVGNRLTIRAVVKDGRYTASPSYWVDVVNTSGCPAE
jgi:hypothetical protein